MRGNYSRYSKRDTVESRLSIDVRELHRGGYLEPGQVSSWRWAYWDGSLIDQVTAKAGDDFVLLFHGRTQQFVAIDRTDCHLGGQRPWFLCPGSSCRKRCARLFSGRDGYLCRDCQNLAYQSTRESETFQAMNRASVIRIKLGGSGSLHAPFPEKPKGMWWRTYEKMADNAHRDSAIGFEGIARQYEELEKFLNKIGR